MRGHVCVAATVAAGWHILAYFLLPLAARVIALPHALPIKHVNHALLNSYRPSCTCAIKGMSCLVGCWMR